jgi:nucleotide-binding universal stress UspA family protein
MLLHVIDVPVMAVYEGEVRQKAAYAMAGEAEEYHGAYVPRMVAHVKEHLHQLMQTYRDVSIRKHVIFDEDSRDLAEFVADEPADLVIVGLSRDEDGEKAILSDSVERVIRYCKAPVITVRQHISQDEAPFFKSIVFASNFKDVSPRAIDNLRTLQRFFDAEIHLLKVIPPRTEPAIQKETLNAIHRFALENDFLNFTANIYTGETKEAAIRHFAESVEADLIAMTISEQNGIAHFLFGNLAEKVAMRARKSMLTIHEY